VIDLSDQNNALVGFAGNTGSDSQACQYCGNQGTWLIGVNWWFNDYTRLALNVTQSEITGGNPLNAASTGGANKNDGATIKGFGMRAQVDW
jgi:phosphate-selective porin OprO and OprP